MKLKNLLILLNILLPFHASAALATELSCDATETEVERHQATASIWANSISRDDSLKVVAAKIVSTKLKEINAGGDRIVKIKIEPNKTLTSYSEFETCEALLKKTKTKSFKVENKRFRSAEELNSWISNFSQGDNIEGKILYKQCPGSCSPSYTYLVKRENSELLLDAKVVCGHARDKGDNLYQLQTSFCKRDGLSLTRPVAP